MTAPVDVVNMALDQIGVSRDGGAVQGINPPVPSNSLAAQVASRNYQTYVNAVFRAAHWNCLRTQAALTLLRAAAGTPENPTGSLPVAPFPWLYSYLLPADCLKVRFLFPLEQRGQAGVPVMTGMCSVAHNLLSAAMPFQVASDRDLQGNPVQVVLTNARAAQAVYTARVDNPDLWDASLLAATVATLSAWFVNPLARNKELLAERVQMARSMIDTARVNDGNEGITSTDAIPDWILVRGLGYDDLARAGEGYGFMAGYDAMTLPSGVTF